MFREMQRKNQALSAEECIRILQEELRGVLSVIGDEGYPYGMPMNHYYCAGDGHIYFHGAAFGHKIDAIRRCDKASFCVYDAGCRRDGEWALNIKSVVVFGRIRIIEDQAHAIDMVRALSAKFTDDAEFIEKDIASAGARTLCFELIPEHITGKLVNEA